MEATKPPMQLNLGAVTALPEKLDTPRKNSTEWLVTVQAQVMCWNEKYNGWLPLDGGGVSSVSLLQRPVSLPPSSTSSRGTIFPVEPPPIGDFAAAEKGSSCEVMLETGRGPRVRSGGSMKKKGGLSGAKQHDTLEARASWSATTTTPSSPAQPASLTPIRTAKTLNGAPHAPALLLGSKTEAGTVGVLARSEYVIFGRRIADNKVLLNCVVVKDVSYRQVMPTFHHWQMGDKKFGLSFKTSYEACKFHNRLQKAIEHLYRQSKSSSGESNLDADELEDEVFVSVDLPVSRESSDSSSARSGGSGSQKLLPTSSRLSRSIHGVPGFITSSPKTRDLERKRLLPYEPTVVELGPQSSTSTNYPYVQFIKDQPGSLSPAAQILLDRTKSGDYHYPQIEPFLRPETYMPGGEHFPPRKEPPSYSSRRGSRSSVKIPIPHSVSPMFPVDPKKPSTAEIIQRRQCAYCLNYYNTNNNEYGACPEAPPPFEKLVRRLSCYRCAECAVFWCMREDGEMPRTGSGRTSGPDLCSCMGTSSRTGSRRGSSGLLRSRLDSRCCKRWTLLLVLSFFVPCLWCYLPLRACGSCSTRCCATLCGTPRGGRHKPMPPHTTASTSGHYESSSFAGRRPRSGSRSL